MESIVQSKKEKKDIGKSSQDENMIKVPVLVNKKQVDNILHYIEQKLDEIRMNVQIGNENVENGFKHIEYLYEINMDTFMMNINTQYEKNLEFISQKYVEKEENMKETHEKEKEALYQEIDEYKVKVGETKKKINEMTNEINKLKELKKYYKNKFSNSVNYNWNYSENDVTLSDNRCCIVFIFAVSYYPSANKIKCWIKYIYKSSFIEYIHGPCIYAVWHCGYNRDSQSIFYDGKELLNDGVYAMGPRVDSICTSWIYDCEFINE